jgi:peroxiredoxin
MVMLLVTITAPATFAAYQVGDTVSDFTLNDSYGNPVSLSDFEGMAVMFNFWQST